MNNRVLKRHLKKYLQIQGTEDLEKVFSFLTELKKNTELTDEVVTNFIEGFHEFFENLDNSYNEFDRVLKARETSMEINETELNRLYAELKNEFLSRDLALQKLRIILTSMESSTTNVGSEELTGILAKVETLVKNQLERSRDLEFIFKESLKLSRSRDFSELGYYLRSCAKSLVGEKVDVSVYFNAQKLQVKNDLGFALLAESGGINYDVLFSMADINRMSGKTIHIQYEGADQPTIILLFSSKESFRDTTPSPAVLQLLKALTSSILSASEAIHFTNQERIKERMEIELNTARLIQQTLVPGELFTVDQQVQLASWFQTSSECGGDWWGNYKLKDGRHIILIGDVTGHGVGSALLTAVVKGFCDSLEGRDQFNFRDFFVELNNQVFNSELNGKCMSMLGICYDPKNRTLEISPAGHPMPYLIQTNSLDPSLRVTELYLGPSHLLGMNSKKLDVNDFEVLKLEIKPGDKLFLYTDGLTETNSPEGIEFSESRLRRVLRSVSPEANAIIFRDEVRKHNEAFRKDAPLLDDISIVIAEFL